MPVCTLRTLVHCEIKSMLPSLVYYNYNIYTYF